jgi:hypothetical protein
VCAAGISTARTQARLVIGGRVLVRVPKVHQQRDPRIPEVLLDMTPQADPDLFQLGFVLLRTQLMISSPCSRRDVPAYCGDIVRASGSCGVAPLPEPPLGRWPGSRNASSSWPGRLLARAAEPCAVPPGEDSTLAVGPGGQQETMNIARNTIVASDWTVALMPFLSLYQRGEPSVPLTVKTASKSPDIRFTTISILFFSHRSPWRKEQGAPGGALVTVPVWVARYG